MSGAISGTMSILPSAPLRLDLSAEALQSNWRYLRSQGGAAACGAAVKADGYGLGAVAVAGHLLAAGCRDFYVATWAEAAELLPYLPPEASLCVFHGVREEDMAFALASRARPVLNSPEQIARWREAGGGPCDIMIDTGMNRLGLDANDVKHALFEGLTVDTAMSHLACAEEDHPMNAMQLMVFRQMARRVGASRLSLANSAGLMLGEDYAMDVTRPGLALYGGVQRAEMGGRIRPVVQPRIQVIQRRTVRGGESVGYGATWVADRQGEAAVLHVGYADGYLRGFSGMGAAKLGDRLLPVLGRVSMDLVVVDVSAVPEVREGDWLDLAFDLPTAAAESGLTQYELLTTLGRRYERHWH